MSQRPFKLAAFPNIARVAGLAAAVALSGASCGGVDSRHAAPRLIPGGGVGNGPIDGKLNVFVTDEQTRAPIAGASVRVGGSAAVAPCTALTDSTGLVSFDDTTCASLKGKQTVTASATGYAPATWIGANGANMTITVKAAMPAAIDSATVSGTIAGWDDLPAPASGHQTLGVVNYSQTRQLGDGANNLPQGTRTVAVLGGTTTTQVPANVCVRNALVDDCAWTLTARTGAQAHYAAIVDQDLMGTPNDDSDDTFTVTAWAIKTGLDFTAGQNAGGESLSLVPDGQMRTLTVSMPSPPPGLDYIAAFPMLDLGGDGRIPITSPILNLATTATRVPQAMGDLASMRYDLLAQAQDAKDKDQPGTLAWIHGADPAATVAVPAWMAPPAALSAAGGSYSFTPVAGATLHGAEIDATTGAGATLWSITIFDGSTSFALPGLSPDPLPAGTLRLKVSALQIPGANLQDVSFDDARDTITALSSDAVTFTR